MTGSSEEFRVRVQASSERFDDDDDAWLHQRADLARGTAELPEVRLVPGAEAGAKGTADSMIIALGSAGAFRAAVAYWRLWLARDRTRSVELTYSAGGEQQHIVVRGTGMDEEKIEALVRDVRAHLER